VRRQRCLRWRGEPTPPAAVWRRAWPGRGRHPCGGAPHRCLGWKSAACGTGAPHVPIPGALPGTIPVLYMYWTQNPWPSLGTLNHKTANPKPQTLNP